MTVAKTLQLRVLIIIGCNALFLCVLRLWCPEVLTIWHEYGRQSLTMLLTSLAKLTGSLGIRLSSADHRVDSIQLAHMFQIMDVLVHIILQCCPRIIISRHIFYVIIVDISIQIQFPNIPLITQDSHQDITLWICTIPLLFLIKDKL